MPDVLSRANDLLHALGKRAADGDGNAPPKRLGTQSPGGATTFGTPPPEHLPSGRDDEQSK